MIGGAHAQPTEIDPQVSDLPASLRFGAAQNWARRETSAPWGAAAKAIITIEATSAPELKGPVRFREVIFSGANSAEIEKMAAILRPRQGEWITQERLASLLALLNHAQTEAGRPLRIAHLPAQSFENGVFTVAVSEQSVARIEIRGANTQQSALLAALAQSSLGALTPANLWRLADAAVIELQQDVTLRVSPAGGAGVGATVEIIVDPAQWAFEFVLNNHAPIFVSRESISAELVGENIFRVGDELVLEGSATVDFQQSQFYRLGYETPLFDDRLTVSFGAGRFRLKPGVAFLRDIGFSLKSDFARAGIKAPLYRTDHYDLALNAGLTRRDIRRTIGVSVAENTIWNWELGASLDTLDRFGGDTEMALTVRHAIDIFDATPKTAATSLRTGVGPGETAWSIDMEHKRDFLLDTDFTLKIFRQTASGPLIGPDQCEYGGGPFGRGYDPIELAGDACMLIAGIIETPTDFLRFGEVDIMLYAAVDHGAVRIKGAIDPNAPGGQALSVSRQSIAFGCEFGWKGRVETSFEVGMPLQSSTIDGFGRSPRFLLSVRSNL